MKIFINLKYLREKKSDFFFYTKLKYTKLKLLPIFFTLFLPIFSLARSLNISTNLPAQPKFYQNTNIHEKNVHDKNIHNNSIYNEHIERKNSYNAGVCSSKNTYNKSISQNKHNQDLFYKNSNNKDLPSPGPLFASSPKLGEKGEISLGTFFLYSRRESGISWRDSFVGNISFDYAIKDNFTAFFSIPFLAEKGFEKRDRIKSLREFTIDPIFGIEFGIYEKENKHHKSLISLNLGIVAPSLDIIREVKFLKNFSDTDLHKKNDLYESLFSERSDVEIIEITGESDESFSSPNLFFLLFSEYTTNFCHAFFNIGPIFSIERHNRRNGHAFISQFGFGPVFKKSNDLEYAILAEFNFRHQGHTRIGSKTDPNSGEQILFGGLSARLDYKQASLQGGFQMPIFEKMFGDQFLKRKFRVALDLSLDF